MSTNKPDSKEDASVTFANVIRNTSQVFPEPAYRPQLIRDATVNQRWGISAGKHKIFGNADGIGTKPEFAERLALATNSQSFQPVAMDGVAMVADDVARDGNFILGIINSVDVNTADPDMVRYLALGMQQACELGRFPLLNGETAELGYRSPGVGKHHVNWNMTALQLINAEKTIDACRLQPGQPIVGFRETSIRSNGLTKARAILEQAYLAEQGLRTKQEWIAANAREYIDAVLSDETILQILESTPLGKGLWEQIQLPWHERFRDITDQLRKPSTLYYPIIYDAQGGVDGEVQIPLVACAHISGGGVPLKVGRMLENSGLGAYMECPFPDPEGIPELMDLAQRYPGASGPLVNDKSACQQWNRGIGFVCVAENNVHAEELIRLAASHGREAAMVGEIIPTPGISWRGHTHWDT